MKNLSFLLCVIALLAACSSAKGDGAISQLRARASASVTAPPAQTADPLSSSSVADESANSLETYSDPTGVIVALIALSLAAGFALGVMAMGYAGSRSSKGVRHG